MMMQCRRCRRCCQVTSYPLFLGLILLCQKPQKVLQDILQLKIISIIAVSAGPTDLSFQHFPQGHVTRLAVAVSANPFSSSFSLTWQSSLPAVYIFIDLITTACIRNKDADCSSSLVPEVPPTSTSVRSGRISLCMAFKCTKTVRLQFHILSCCTCFSMSSYLWLNK